MQITQSTFSSRGIVGISSHIVTPEDVAKADHAAQLRMSWDGLRLLKSCQRHYLIDDRQHTDPVGKSGRRLESIWEFTVEDEHGLLDDVLAKEQDGLTTEDMLAMDKVAFLPWVGTKYREGNRFGARVLLLGISHHGQPHEMHARVTREVVLRDGKGKRSSYTKFWTTLSRFLTDRDKSTWIADAQRAEVFDHVAFYNYVQERVGDYSGIAPTPAMWKAAANPFRQLLDTLQPEIVVVVGATMRNHLPAMPPGIEVCYVKHPAGGFGYATWNPVLRAAVERVLRKKDC